LSHHPLGILLNLIGKFKQQTQLINALHPLLQSLP